MTKEALFWEKLDDGRVKCMLCPHRCLIADGKHGICRIRGNKGGILFSEGYGMTTALAMDPIEKKPLFHFKPGTYILSLGPNGCNLRCKWCQNWEISQSQVATRFISAENVVRIATDEGSSGIAFTYTEPLIWYEYILDVAEIARHKDLSIVLVTNGYINPEPLEKLLPYIDAMNIDLKSMKDETYVEFMGGHLAPVLETIEVSSAKCHIEITNLLVPTVNDSMEEISSLVDFVVSVNPLIPLHFSRYHPCFHFDIAPTSAEKLLEAYNIAKEKLPYVYLGNILIDGTEDTFCPRCQNRLISRRGFSARLVGIENGRCAKCKSDVDIVF